MSYVVGLVLILPSKNGRSYEKINVVETVLQKFLSEKTLVRC